MQPVCTCGAQLPEDARFCHRCGKPQWESVEEAAPELEPGIETPPPVPSPVAEQSVGFGNPVAIRTSLLVASITTILEIVPIVQFIAPILGGFASVSLYQRRTGKALSPRGGAKLGWITAILNALLFTVFLTLNFMVGGAAIFEGLRENMRHQATSPAQQQALLMMNDPRILALIVLMTWIFCFVCSSLLYMAGGALGARIFRSKAS